MDDRYQYLLLMAGCLLITLPLEFLLRARVYRRPRRLLLSLLPVLAIFLVWDVVGIVRGHWWYSATYTTGKVMLSRVVSSTARVSSRKVSNAIQSQALTSVGASSGTTIFMMTPPVVAPPTSPDSSSSL